MYSFLNKPSRAPSFFNSHTMLPSQYKNGILSLWILCVITYNSSVRGLKTRCNETDLQKLLSFKQQVRDSSGLLSTWSKKRDCCRWAGVECDHFTLRVTKLSLPCVGFIYFTKIDILHSTDCLAGEFSLSNLLELEFLNYLDLSYNNLLFTPPHSSGNYSSKLLYLDLSVNDPKLELDNLTWLIQFDSLEYLNLNGISIRKSHWLQSMNKLPSLSELHLSGCQLHDINSSLEFVNFTLLQVLDLSANNFQSHKLPKWLFNLSYVRDLDLSMNSFQGHLLKTILNLQMLKSLRMFQNELNGPIPNCLGQLKNLKYLDLSENFFVGPIPETVGNLSSLIELSLWSNPLNGSLPESLGLLPNLESLEVDDTFLTGVISETNFLQLSNLEDLSLGSPALTLHFDPHWIPPFQLQTIYLAHVHPELPTWLYTQKPLQLRVINSSLSFDDEDKFWKLASEVEYLKLENNSINGDFSKVVLNSKIISMTGNNLRGGLPQISPNVTIFKANHNPFTGPLSSFLCQKMEGKNNLSYLQISNACLFGALTKCWMNWKSLVHVNLDNNGLTGKIPKSMSLLSNLISLHLNHNNLFGNIPTSFQNLQKLSILNLGENKFSGIIPYWISPSVKVLLLRSNQLSDKIPLQLCQLSSLLVLDISDNRLLGTIPNCLHNITAMVSGSNLEISNSFWVDAGGVKWMFAFYSFSMLIKGIQLNYLFHGEMIMQVIDLSNNNLTGTIPLEIFTLSKLWSLNLSNNQLTGKLPKEIGNLKQLESLDLSCNHIKGEIPHSMSELSFLGFLNLSFNNFAGEIPPMAQFQRFDVLSYIGNLELCGAPLTKNCTQEEKPNLMTPIEIVDDEEFLSWFYFGMGVGFAIGFWAVFASLFFIRKWRHAYFRFLDELKCQLYVYVVIKLNIFH